MVDIETKQRTSRIVRLSQLPEELRQVDHLPAEEESDIETLVQEFVNALKTGDTGIERTYPTRPAHTCGRQLTIVTIYADQTDAGVSSKRNWKAGKDHITGQTVSRCEGCYHDRVVRICNQIISELDAGHDLISFTIPTADKSKLSATLRQRRARGADVVYLMLPQDDVCHVITNQAIKHFSDPVPHDSGLIYDLLKLICDTSKRTSSNEGWGGDFQGNKGDGRQRGKSTQAQVWGYQGIAGLAEEVDKAGLVHSTLGGGKRIRRFRIIETADTVAKFFAKRSGWYLRGTQTPITDITEIKIPEVEAECHDLGTSKDINMYLSRDILEVENKATPLGVRFIYPTSPNANNEDKANAKSDNLDAALTAAFGRVGVTS